jgi:dihydroorotase
MTDLILRGGCVVDPASGRDETADVAFADGRVKAVGPDLPDRGAEIADVRGLLVVPGLIDLHTHTRILGRHLPRGRCGRRRAAERNHDFC